MSRTLLFEIGCEEIPSSPLDAARVQLAADAARALDEAHLGHGEVVVHTTPRRIALIVRDVADRQDDVTLRYKGPAAKAAYDVEGRPTQAAEGFARRYGVDVSELVRETGDGGEYVWAIVRREGVSATDVLPGILAELAEGLQWPKAMRWGAGEARFIRPVRWLVALLGDEVLPVTFAGVTAGRTSQGHRFIGGDVEVPSADAYAEALRSVRVIVDEEERARVIREGIEDAARSAGGRAVVPEKTFAEVVNLVEWPTVACGRFDEAFLTVPREVLEEAMESHQRYFPVEADDGSLAARFIVVHNGDPARTTSIVAGHERVIRARLADAAFFFEEDRKLPLEAYVERLDGMVFHKELGTLAQKVARIERLAARLADLVGISEEERAVALRAAHLCKADLVTHVVVEFTSLQGVMGYHYALASGESQAVARAIFEHYRPRFAGDALPSSRAGMLVSAADKLDTICGIHAIGQAPTGSSDPFALRRFAIGIIAMTLDGGLRFPLQTAIEVALAGYEGVIEADRLTAAAAEVKSFILGRFEGVLKERGLAYDTIDAVLAIQSDDLADALARASALEVARTQAPEVFEDLAIAYRRAANLGDASLGVSIDRTIMGKEELALASALDEAEVRVAEALRAARYDEVVAHLAALRGPIDAFFEAVLVMDEDERVRTNRLRLLNRFVAVFSAFADIGAMVA